MVKYIKPNNKHTFTLYLTKIIDNTLFRFILLLYILYSDNIQLQILISFVYLFIVIINPIKIKNII